jgi:hypothetical protein
MQGKAPLTQRIHCESHSDLVRPKRISIDEQFHKLCHGIPWSNQFLMDSPKRLIPCLHPPADYICQIQQVLTALGKYHIRARSSFDVSWLSPSFKIIRVNSKFSLPKSFGKTFWKSHLYIQAHSFGRKALNAVNIFPFLSLPQTVSRGRFSLFVDATASTWKTKGNRSKWHRSLGRTHAKATNRSCSSVTPCTSRLSFA